MYVCLHVYTDTLILTRALDSYYYISLIHNMKNQILHISHILLSYRESLRSISPHVSWWSLWSLHGVILMTIDCTMSVNNYILVVQYLLGVLSHSEIKIRHNINFS